MYKRKCAWCGKDFESKYFNTKYCSIECRELNKKMNGTDFSKYPIPKNCKVCGKKFMANSTGTKYCSDDCRELAMKKRLKKLTCAICGKEFESVKCNARYCSQECRYKAQKLNYKTYKNYGVEQDNHTKVRKTSKRHLSSINRKARDANMSYGEYQAKLYMESMR